MPYVQLSARGRLAGAGRLLAAAALVAITTPAAFATNLTETTDFSDNPASPYSPWVLTLGDNFLSGTINTYGDRVGDHGERTHQDQDFITFTIPTGFELTKFIVASGTSILTAPPRDDSVFLGLANGSAINNLSYTSAAALAGYTLVTQAKVGTDILPDIGNQVAPAYFGFPQDASGFVPPLGPGSYTLWLYDGDEAATYRFNAVVATAPEPATWAMMIGGFGAIGSAMRRRRRPAAAVALA